MNRTSTIFLRVIILLIGIGTLAFLLWEPHIEGKNIHSTLFEIYFKDPFLAFAYIASIPFFVTLNQAFKLLGYIGQDKAFSQVSIQALRRIRYCTFASVGFIVIGEVIVMLSNSDDRPPVVLIGLIATLIFVSIAAAADVFEKLLQTPVEMKSKNDPTV